jgi:hypothetical protein
MAAGSDPRPIVYLGPSLARGRAQQLLAADYRPPIKRGDLPARHDGTVIIIDGEFRQNLSVSPNEILRLLDQGTQVTGAASMGALRAVELMPYGMVGCGWVYDSYRSGRIVADDEVAVTYAPRDFECLTVPLVNVRRWLDLLQTRCVLARATARRLLGCARAMFYADRSEATLMREWTKIIGPMEVKRLLHASGGCVTDVKAADAELVLGGAMGQSEREGEQQ